MQTSLPTVEELRILSHIQDEPCLTITMPTDGFSANGGRMGSTRMKNLLRAADEAVRTSVELNGHGEALLRPLRDLVEQTTFWQRQDQGLALFNSPALDGGEPRAYSTPFLLPEEITLSRRFHLSSLLPFITADGNYYVLVVGKQKARLYRGTRGTLRQIEVPGMPDSFDDIEKYFEHERAHHFSPGSQGRTPGGQTSFAGHGLDASDRDDIKRRVLIYLQQIDNALKPYFAGRRDPLVLVALEYLHPLWSDACNYQGYKEEAGVKFDADILDERKIQDLAWPTIEPILKEGVSDALERVREALSKGLGATKLQDVLPAASDGRVGTLLVADRPHRVTGRYDAASRHVQINQSQAPAPRASGAQSEFDGNIMNSEDLVDRAIIETFNHGGEVFAVPAADLPEHREMAAILRY